MAQFYKILKADPLGEPWTPSQPGAKAIQNFWCQVEGEDLAVSIGKQVGNTLTPGQHVYGDLMKATSQKGTDYWKFKGQIVPEDVQRPTDAPGTPAQATAQQAVGTGQNVSDVIPGWAITMNNMVEFIYKEMRRMSDIEEAKLPVIKGVDDVQPPANLDDIFTPEVPEDV